MERCDLNRFQRKSVLGGVGWVSSVPEDRIKTLLLVTAPTPIPFPSIPPLSFPLVLLLLIACYCKCVCKHRLLCVWVVVHGLVCVWLLSMCIPMSFSNVCMCVPCKLSALPYLSPRGYGGIHTAPSARLIWVFTAACPTPLTQHRGALHTEAMYVSKCVSMHRRSRWFHALALLLFHWWFGLLGWCQTHCAAWIHARSIKMI